MANNKKQSLRDQIEMKMLTALNALLESKEEVDVAKLKAFYGFKLDEQAHEAAMKRNEIAERKLAGADDERDFSVEETVKGVQTMLGKGELP